MCDFMDFIGSIIFGIFIYNSTLMPKLFSRDAANITEFCNLTFVRDNKHFLDGIKQVVLILIYITLYKLFYSEK